MSEQLSTSTPLRRAIGVSPPERTIRHRRLLGALESCFPVDFGPWHAGADPPPDGLLVFASEKEPDIDPGLEGIPRLTLPDTDTDTETAGSGEDETIRMTRSSLLAHPLRGRTLTERDRPAPAPAAWSPDGHELARLDGATVWLASAGDLWRHWSLFALAELSAGETLRDRLRPGRFMGLAPLLHLLWRVCADGACEPRRLSASFILDDPNLHWTSYGHVDYQALAEHAGDCGYHVGIATVPLDGWLVNAEAASLFRRNRTTLSLLIHGNNHVSRELANLREDRQAELAMAQALRRAARLQRRCGVPVRRVMAPPHGASSEQALRAMFRLGFDAAAISRPHPWLDGQPPPHATVGWRPAELVAGGLPVLPRHPLDGPPDELVFRALLGQPLIVYGHHWDLADGLGPLASAAETIDSLGEVSWMALDEIAARSYALRRQGGVSIVELHSRHASVPLPRDSDSLVVTVPATDSQREWSHLRIGASLAPVSRVGEHWSTGVLPVTPETPVSLTLEPGRPLDAAQLPSPPRRPWPLLRRALVEGRDRAMPLRRSGAPDTRAGSKR